MLASPSPAGRGQRGEMDPPRLWPLLAAMWSAVSPLSESSMPFKSGHGTLALTTPSIHSLTGSCQRHKGKESDRRQSCFGSLLSRLLQGMHAGRAANQDSSLS